MFGTLLETTPRRRRRSRVALLSAAAHAVAITIAAAATSGPHGAPPAKPEADSITWIAPRPPAPQIQIHAGGRSGPRGTVAPPTSEVPTTLPPIVDLPTGAIPEPVIGRSSPEPIGEARPGTAPGTSIAPDPDGVFREVDKVAMRLPGAPTPEYPSALRQAGIEGTAQLRFVVDSAGRVEPASVVVLSSTHPSFGQAARRALLATRFAPAEAGGHRVRQLFEQSFEFTLSR